MQIGFVAGGAFIGSSQPSAKQAGARNEDTAWTPLTSIVNTGDATSLTISVRNYAAGGWGNDFAVDELSLFPMATAGFSLEVRSPVPGYEFSKTSDSVSGSSVNPGDEITYTLTGDNTGATELSTTIEDDLSDVFEHAVLVAGSLNASTGEAKIDGAALTWDGTLAPGQTVSISYTVKVDEDAWNVSFRNHATSEATPPGGVPPITPPPGETEHHTPPTPPVTPTTTPGTPTATPVPPTGTPAEPGTGLATTGAEGVGSWILIAVLLLAAGGAVLVVVRRRRDA
ncbi:isopeptide-forming domain-containing fimbrial protein [Pseudoclavibacter chungangensis]|uniref:Isopeptide-forming domain-containing fimbrial protein n=1 Tax=Pseudoclavibacter chungangensis TaxID=587635 RepID=A0A7J5C0I9_9MICO|nr:isopeptide-forming domain-containing fimbrial protein [Pseudoclavibacter chungangensis]KAB1660278.1 isopeptide-forming domain-containing fimbrial protein [Pseudoclavibacter chungangensis]NYJ65626.1 fimbrial isopeptide formation D2 family protein/LPXTG-motif cell wall-anchored protein [Pseudoclavibacter chungangensis]